MPLHSILDVEVNSANFEVYKRSFDQYTQLVKALPNEFAASWKALNKHKNTFNELVASMVAANYQSKQQVAAQKEADRLTRSASDRWLEMAKSTKSVASHMKSMTVEMVKWVGPLSVFTGLIGAGAGLFGFDKLAGSVASQRQRAMGMGVSYGQQASFNLAYGRFVNAPGMLSNVSASLHDATSPGYTGLMAAGLTPGFLNSHNAAQVSAALINKIPELFKGTPTDLVGAKLNALSGLNQDVSLQEVVRILATNQHEMSQANSRFRSNVGPLGLTAAQSKAYQDLTTKISSAGSAIETVFARTLLPMARPLGDLSQSFEKVVASFAGSKDVKESIDELAAGFEKLAKYMKPTAGKTSTDDKISIFGYKPPAWVRMILNLGPTVTNPFSSSGSSASGNPSSRSSASGYPSPNLFGLSGPLFPSLPGSYASSIARQSESFNTLVRQVRGLEGSGDRAISPAGAIGRFQIMPATARQYGFDPSRLMDPAYNEMVSRTILADLNKRYRGDTREILAAYNAGPGIADLYRRRGDDLSVLPAETQRYIENATRRKDYASSVQSPYQGQGQQPAITIHNQLGGDTNITATGLAFGGGS